MPFHDTVLTRRAVLYGLGVASTLGLVAGCTITSDGPTTDPDADSPDQDEQVARKSQQLIANALGTLTATQAARPGLSAMLEPLALMHRSHLEILDQTVQPPSPSGTNSSIPVDRLEALNRIRSSEINLATELADLAGSAESGDLARVLAAMSAGGLQRLAALPPAIGGRP
ncbi:MAG TPA: hypothetical protein PLO27_03210 [Marmoricola sp.]|nr:hypothetical protein [Marmoricola sp.]HNI70303.1 hypothetical protein [Marmoricola sp.]